MLQLESHQLPNKNYSRTRIGGSFQVMTERMMGDDGYEGF